jgi:hypothetical protein
MVDRSKDSKNSSLKEVGFNELLLEVIDDTLTYILGEEAKKVLYTYLKWTVFLEKQDIGKELAAFDEGLKKLFGSGANVIEDAVVKEMFSRMIGLKISANDTFLDIVEKMRTHFIDQPIDLYHLILEEARHPTRNSQAFEALLRNFT